MEQARKIIDALVAKASFKREEITYLLEQLYFVPQPGFLELRQYLFAQARLVRERYYGRQVFLRGLIEFTNYCKNDCYYCGIRHANRQIDRYRLTLPQILGACALGYANGFRTFVLQGGEDLYFSSARMEMVIRAIKAAYPDCALTLSVGEKEPAVYARWFAAGADRYLLRHETATPNHYARLHPPQMSFAHRMDCLMQLKQIGFQVGAGMMIGAPWQTAAMLVDDLGFLAKFRPAMVGLGPFIPQHATPLAAQPPGSIELTLLCLALVRLLLPQVLLPATTALATLAPDGTLQGLNAGANVIMPNISPLAVRRLYTLYDNKKVTDGESVEGLKQLESLLYQNGYTVAMVRGDSKMV